MCVVLENIFQLSQFIIATVAVAVCSSVRASCGVRWCYFHLSVNRRATQFTFKVDYFKLYYSSVYAIVCSITYQFR